MYVYLSSTHFANSEPQHSFSSRLEASGDEVLDRSPRSHLKRALVTQRLSGENLQYADETALVIITATSPDLFSWDTSLE